MPHLQGAGSRRRRWAALLASLALAALHQGSPVAAAEAAGINLGAASTFAVLAGGPSITNSGSTRIDGDIGIHPGTSIDGFPPGNLEGELHLADGAAREAKEDQAAAYDDAATRVPTAVAEGGKLGGLTLAAGVYSSGGAGLALAGSLTLDGSGDLNAVWIFQASSTLATAASSSVVLVNGAQACNVHWQVAGAVTLGADSSFAGNILARSSITILSRVRLAGRALAQHGAVTLMNDEIAYPTCLLGRTAGAPAAGDRAGLVSPTGSPAAGALLVALVLPPTDETAAATSGFGGLPVLMIAITLALLLAAARVVDRRRAAAFREVLARERSGGPQGWDYGSS